MIVEECVHSFHVTIGHWLFTLCGFFFVNRAPSGDDWLVCIKVNSFCRRLGRDRHHEANVGKIRKHTQQEHSLRDYSPPAAERQGQSHHWNHPLWSRSSAGHCLYSSSVHICNSLTRKTPSPLLYMRKQVQRDVFVGHLAEVAPLRFTHRTRRMTE